MSFISYDQRKTSAAGSVANLSETDLKGAWLVSMRTWGDSGIVGDHTYSSPFRAAHWEAEDREFASHCDQIRKISDKMSRELTQQRANRGDVASRSLALKSSPNQTSKGDAEPEPVADQPRSPMTREKFYADLTDRLKAAGIETPDNLSEPVYSAEQWAKWGR